MKLHGITVNNFMSLQSFHMSDLDDHTNFLVGPNGAGKTSVFRALRAVCDTFATISQANYNEASARHNRLLLDLRRRTSQGFQMALPKEIDVSLNVTLDTSKEKELLAAFLAAVLSDGDTLSNALSREQPPSYTRDEGIAMFSAWMLDALQNSDLTWLLDGTIRMRSFLAAHDPKIMVGYTCVCAGEPITFMAGWDPSFSLGRVTTGELEPSNLPGYQSGQALIQYLKQANGQTWEHFVGMLSGREPSPITPHLDIQTLIQALAALGESLVARGTSRSPYPTATDRLSKLTLLPLRDPQNDRVSVATVFSQILREAFVFTENVRTPLTSIKTYRWEQLTQPKSDSGNEQELPVQLFWLKNGDRLARDRYKHIQTTFQQLVGGEQCLNVVAEQLSVPPGSPIIEPPSPNVEQRVAIELTLIDQDREIPIADQGAGIWELLILSVLIQESEGRIVLLDEPAANLHPSMQRALRDLLHDTNGQFIVVTHSQHLLPSQAKHIRQVFRLAKTATGTQAYQLTLRQKLGITEEKLEQELLRSSDTSGLLFAAGVVLVEGLTEVTAYTAWTPQCSYADGRSLTDLGIALYSVGSNTNFGFFIRFLSEYQIPWVVICDGDALQNRFMWGAVQAVNPSCRLSSTLPFGELKPKAEVFSVFTPNTSEQEDFEDIPEVKAYLESVTQQQSKIRAAFESAQLISCPPPVALMWDTILTRLGVSTPPNSRTS